MNVKITIRDKDDKEVELTKEEQDAVKQVEKEFKEKFTEFFKNKEVVK